MGTDDQSRPVRAAQVAFGDAASLLDQPYRCAACSRVLTAPRSLSRGFGPDCWARMQGVLMADRRRAVRLSLGALTGAVDHLSGPALLTVAEALAGALDVIAGEVR